MIERGLTPGKGGKDMSGHWVGGGLVVEGVDEAYLFVAIRDCVTGLGTPCWLALMRACNSQKPSLTDALQQTGSVSVAR